MIKRIHVLILVLIGLLYLIGAGWKYGWFEQNPKTEIQPEQKADQPDQAKVRQFWSLYQQATNERAGGNYRQAVLNYEKALDVNPEHEDARYYLGNMQLLLHEFPLAEKNWLRLEASNPETPRTFLQLGTLYSCMAQDNTLLNYIEAEKYIRKAWSLNRTETGAPLLLAKIKMLNQDFDEARSLLENIIQTNQDNYQTSFLLGYILWKQNNKRGNKNSTTIKTQERFRELYQRAFSIHQRLQDGKILGEGATKEGTAAMLSEGLFCDAFASAADSIMTYSDANALVSDFNAVDEIIERHGQ